MRLSLLDDVSRRECKRGGHSGQRTVGRRSHLPNCVLCAGVGRPAAFPISTRCVPGGCVRGREKKWPTHLKGSESWMVVCRENRTEAFFQVQGDFCLHEDRLPYLTWVVRCFWHFRDGSNACLLRPLLTNRSRRRSERTFLNPLMISHIGLSLRLLNPGTVNLYPIEDPPLNGYQLFALLCRASNTPTANLEEAQGPGPYSRFLHVQHETYSAPPIRTLLVADWYSCSWSEPQVCESHARGWRTET